MAQFPSTPAFGAGYPPFPIYPPYPTHPQQQMPSNQPGSRQSNALGSNPHTPTPLSNAMRYEGNTHVNPLAQFPLPHFFPPPPPPANYTPAPGTPTSFPHFPQIVNGGSQYAQQYTQSFPQLHTQMGNLFSQSHGGLPALQTPMARIGQSRDNRVNENMLSTATRPDHDIDVGQTSDNPSLSSLGQPKTYNMQQMNRAEYQPQQSTDVREVSPVVHEPLPVQPKDSLIESLTNSGVTRKYQGMELREHAKAAVLDLNSHDIGFKDLVAEGVSAQIVRELFTDLGLELNTLNTDTTNETPLLAATTSKKLDEPAPVIASTQPVSIPQKATNAAAANTSAKLSQGHLSVGLPPSAISPGLERKDRIAQLLAAKTGKVTSNNTGSKSASPTLISESVGPMLATAEQQPLVENVPAVEPSLNKSTKYLPQTELVRQKMERLRQEAANKLESQRKANEVPAQTASNTSDNIAATKVPTDQPQFQPIDSRPFTKGSVFSSMIPGLFMTGDEELEEKEQTNTPFVPDPLNPSSVKEYTPRFTDTNFGPSESLKRPAVTDLQEEGRPDPKRPALSRSTSLDGEIKMHDAEAENASEGEIIEEELQSHQHQPLAAEDIVMTEPASEVYVNNSQNGMSAITPSHQEATQPYHQNESVHQNLYHSKQSEIDIMRKRIVEMQQKKGLKRNSSFASSPMDSAPTTPVSNQVVPGSTSSPFIPKPQEAEQSMTKEATPPNARPITKLTSAQIAEKAARLKADFIRQRALRQKQLTEGMPVLNDEVNKTQERVRQSKARLIEIRTEIQKHNEELSRARQEEGQLVDEIERLEKQLQDGVTGQKQFSSELKQITQQAAAEANTEQNFSQPVAQSVSNINPIDIGVQQQVDTNIQNSSTSEDSHENEQAENLHHVKSDAQVAEVIPLSSSHPTDLQDRISLSEQHSDDAVTKNDLTPEIDTSGDQSAGDADIETDDDESMDQSDDESEDTRMSVDEASDGSASMSDSGSDDYEPAEAGSPDHQSGESHNAQTQEHLQPQDHQTPLTDSNDDYEPSDNLDDVSPVENRGTSQLHSTSVTNASSSSGQSPVNNIEQQQPIKTIEIISEVVPGSKADDQENGLQLSEANTLTKTQDSSTTDQHVLSGDTVSSSARFVPYQSPLSLFKSYRFHPSFPDLVKDGYRSLTYSNKIDPANPICPTELAGKECGDLDCQEQHFGQMVLSDDKILVQMSSANDLSEKAVRDQYLLGLKQVIARLRQEGVKEFSLVAAALSQYRREWAITHPSL